MSSSDESSSDISESEIDDYEAQAYSKLKAEEHTVKKPGGTFKCPFCSDTLKGDYGHKEILQHATDMATSNGGVKVKANHLALSKYLNADVEQPMDLDDADDTKDLSALTVDAEQKPNVEPVDHADDTTDVSALTEDAEQKPTIEPVENGFNVEPFTMDSDSSENDSSDVSESESKDYELQAYFKLKADERKVKNLDGTYKCPFCLDRKKQDYRRNEILQHATSVVSSKRTALVKGNHMALVKYLKLEAGKSASESSMRPEVAELEPAMDSLKDGKLVYPWMGVLVNVPREWKEGRFVGGSGSKLKEQLYEFNPLKVVPLWNFKGHTGSAIVEFRKDWSGFEDARAFQNHFNLQHHGKNDWDDKGSRDEGFYGWVAQSDDYYVASPIADYLSKKGDLKTVAEIIEEEKRKEQKLVNDLHSQIDAKVKHTEELESKLKDFEERTKQLCEEKEELQQQYRKEIEAHRALVSANNFRVLKENDALKKQLEAKMREHQDRRLQLDALQPQYETKIKGLADEKEKNKKECTSLEMAALVQQKVEENVKKLVEDQEKERHTVIERQLQSRKQLSSTQHLELQVKILKGNIKVMKCMGGEDDSQYMKKIDKLSEELAEKMEGLEYVDSLNQSLIIKEKRSSEELQEGGKELIKGLLEVASDKHIIRVKKMGELDMKVFQNACKKGVATEEEDEIRSVELYSHWEHEIQNPEWRPFRTIFSEDGNRRVVVEDDEKLIKLRDELGPEVYTAVTTALLELNEYHPRSRSSIPVLWNFKERKAASKMDAARYVLKLWTKNKS